MYSRYLEEIGIDRKEQFGQFEIPWYRLDQRWKRFKQRRKFGFPSCSCYDMDITMCHILYSLGCQYLHDAKEVVDLTYHKFLWNGKTYNQEELICLMLEKLQTYFLLIDILDEPSMEMEKGLTEAWDIWNILRPAMWW